MPPARLAATRRFADGRTVKTPAPQPSALFDGVAYALDSGSLARPRAAANRPIPAEAAASRLPERVTRGESLDSGESSAQVDHFRARRRRELERGRAHACVLDDVRESHARAVAEQIDDD